MRAAAVTFENIFALMRMVNLTLTNKQSLVRSSGTQRSNELLVDYHESEISDGGAVDGSPGAWAHDEGDLRNDPGCLDVPAVERSFYCQLVSHDSRTHASFQPATPHDYKTTHNLH